MRAKHTKKFNIQCKVHNFKDIKMIPRREKTCFSFSDNLPYLIFIIDKYFSYDKKITIYNKKEKR